VNTEDRLIIAIDLADQARVLTAVNDLRDCAAAFKIGSTAFNAAGPRIVKAVAKMNKKVFLDLKLFDITEQVAGAAAAITIPGVFMTTVHALGGIEMMRAAKQATLRAADAAGIEPPLVVGVTVLTSLDNEWLSRIGIPDTSITVPKLALAAREAGLDGVVASAHEVSEIKKVCGTDFITVVPGIRGAGAPGDDQKRIATPGYAIGRGADYLVVGRPITAAADPVESSREIIDEIGIAIKERKQ